MANEVFISYSRKDYDVVRKIKEEIEREVGINCWMDTEEITSEQRFIDVIVDAIDSHDTMLFMMSEDSMKSKWATKELSYAEDEMKKVVLVHLDNSKMRGEFKFLYGHKNIIEWNNPLQHDRLIRDLKSWHSAPYAKKSSDDATTNKNDAVENRPFYKVSLLKINLFILLIVLFMIFLGGLGLFG